MSSSDAPTAANFAHFFQSAGVECRSALIKLRPSKNSKRGNTRVDLRLRYATARCQPALAQFFANRDGQGIVDIASSGAGWIFAQRTLKPIKYCLAHRAAS